MGKKTITMRVKGETGTHAVEYVPSKSDLEYVATLDVSLREDWLYRRFIAQLEAGEFVVLRDLDRCCLSEQELQHEREELLGLVAPRRVE